jgi:hypothetical protein
VPLGFKTELKLKLNDRVLAEFLKKAGVVCHAWNWGLALTQPVFDRDGSTRIAISRPANPWDFSFAMGAMTLKKAAS